MPEIAYLRYILSSNGEWPKLGVSADSSTFLFQQTAWGPHGFGLGWAGLNGLDLLNLNGPIQAGPHRPT